MDLFQYTPGERTVDGWLISSSIPIPEDRQHRQRTKWERPNFPFAQLMVNDSFRFNPPTDMHIVVAQNLVSGAAATFRKKDPHGRTFTTRQMGDYIRCWRQS